MNLGKGVDGLTYALAGQPHHPTPCVKYQGVLSRCYLKSVDNTNNVCGNGLRMLYALNR
ncbi:unnamed protein product [Dicrocoelium dendriticum]|nr:unnamed protein product [Dicrocoelium dendriticum]